MRAYYFDDIPGDQRAPHDSGEPVSVDTLKNLGVLYWNIPLEGNEDAIDAIAREREYKNRDVINVTKEGLGDLYDEKLKTFFAECVFYSGFHGLVFDVCVCAGICMRMRRFGTSNLVLASSTSAVGCYARYAGSVGT